MGIETDSCWIETFTGKRFYPLNPRVEDVDIRDIAHALSMTCRFGGHCRQFYSVAEHSVRASYLVSGNDRLATLLHDSAEAYLPDMPRPIKYSIDGFKDMEKRIEGVIFKKFGMDGFDASKVKRADNIMLATEGRDLMDNISGWYLAEPPDNKRIRDVWKPDVAECEFMNRFSLLGGKG